MKTLFTLITLSVFCFTAKQTQAQTIRVNPYTEFTQMSAKTGLSIGTVIPLEYLTVEVGGFYQHATFEENNEQLRYMEYEKSFYGFNTSVYLIQWQKFDLALNIRTGKVNKEFFSITPGFKGELKVNKRVNIQVGTGIRNLTPTLITGLVVKL